MRGHAVSAEEYLRPTVAAGLPWRDLPVVPTDHPAVEEVAMVVHGDPDEFDVPIVPWPDTSGRPLDPGTGVGGGTVRGTFACTWKGDRLEGRNEAVNGRYTLGFAVAPEDSSDEPRANPPEQLLLWHINHHPDGGQLFASLEGSPFLVLAIPAAPDPDLDRAIVIRSEGDVGICLRPGVWHDGGYPASGDGSFLTRQGAVHARISCDITDEFGCLLRVPLGR